MSNPIKKGGGKYVGLCRMSEYSGVGLHKFHCIYSYLCIFIPGFLSLYRFKIYINTISNPTTTAVDPMPAPIPIAVGLLSSSDGTVREEVANEMYYTSCM
jgi:hypothetical protein